MSRGCRLFCHINCVPGQPYAGNLQLAGDQTKGLKHRLAQYRRTLPAVFIASPPDKVALSGCLVAGRGFIQIDASGDVEPCPLSPYCGSNPRVTPLEEAPASPLFKKILASNAVVDKCDGRCALWKRLTWVETLLKGQSPGPKRDRRFDGGRPTTKLLRVGKQFTGCVPPPEPAARTRTHASSGSSQPRRDTDPGRHRPRGGTSHV